MRAIVLSDSHGDTNSCDRAIYSSGKLDMIIHLGDIFRDVDYLEAVYDDIPVVSVLGNNDFLHYGNYEDVIDFDGHKIFICHGHTLSVSSGIDRLSAAAKRCGCEAALFGHTHKAFSCCDDDLLILNPGSTSRPRGGKPSFAILETDSGKLESVIVDWVI